MKRIIISCLIALILYCSCEKVILKDSSGTTGTVTDIIPPTVSSSDPSNGATNVAINKTIAISFSETMNATTISGTTIVLKQGSTAVSGAVAYSGTTATFTPGSNFAANTVYTCTISTSVKDLAGNAMANNYVFSFTTGSVTDKTPPTVTSIDPTSGATAVALNKAVTTNFSEAIDPLTITSTTFTVKQGSTSVAGVVSSTSQSAIFTPSSNYSANTTYTATVTTGIKDVAGNALASNYSWTFTTSASAAVSFATDIIPILNTCESCHTHGWAPSSSASTYYNNLVSKSYVVPSNYTSSKIYSKINGGHPGTGYLSTTNKNKIISWMQDGSKNN